jgi:Spy/CpxP family protein refolding chaperone
MKRILFAAVFTLLLVNSSFAQQRGLRGRNPGAALKSALALTDDQVTAITNLIRAEQTRTQAIRTEIQQRRQTLESLLSAASPVAVDVGNAAIALRAAEAKIKAEQDYLVSQIKQQLTGEQQQKLDALLANGGRGLLPGLLGSLKEGRGLRGRN